MTQAFQLLLFLRCECELQWVDSNHRSGPVSEVEAFAMSVRFRLPCLAVSDDNELSNPAQGAKKTRSRSPRRQSDATNPVPRLTRKEVKSEMLQINDLSEIPEKIPDKFQFMRQLVFHGLGIGQTTAWKEFWHSYQFRFQRRS